MRPTAPGVGVAGRGSDAPDALVVAGVPSWSTRPPCRATTWCWPRCANGWRAVDAASPRGSTWSTSRCVTWATMRPPPLRRPLTVLLGGASAQTRVTAPVGMRLSGRSSGYARRAVRSNPQKHGRAGQRIARKCTRFWAPGTTEERSADYQHRHRVHLPVGRASLSRTFRPPGDHIEPAREAEQRAPQKTPGCSGDDIGADVQLGESSCRARARHFAARHFAARHCSCERERCRPRPRRRTVSSPSARGGSVGRNSAGGRDQCANRRSLHVCLICQGRSGGSQGRWPPSRAIRSHWSRPSLPDSRWLDPRHVDP